MFAYLKTVEEEEYTRFIVEILSTEGSSGFKGGLSAENYIAIAKTARATATRDLADLVAKGALIKRGELRPRVID